MGRSTKMSNNADLQQPSGLGQRPNDHLVEPMFAALDPPEGEVPAPATSDQRSSATLWIALSVLAALAIWALLRFLV